MSTDATTPDIRGEVDVTTTVGPFSVSASFVIRPGITALFGPSGAGKSVTLATVAGLLRPDRGTIALEGRAVADATRRLHVRTQDRHVGMVFQHAALLPHRSPLDNVALGVREGDRTARRKVAEEWLERVHAAHLAHTSTATLSGGEQQRIALARALAGRPRLLLLDEPFSALDRPTRHALRTLVRDLVDSGGLAALLVTHDLDDILHVADRVVRYEPGTTISTVELPSDAADHITRLLGLTP